MSEQPRARIFISCGQREKEEKDAAAEIKRRLEGQGYDVYVAVKHADTESLLAGILRNLEACEYFIFIDFVREYLSATPCFITSPAKPAASRRGSLFSHQELALACYLRLDAIGFQQEGLNYHDGMMQAIGLNPKPFKKAGELPDLIEAEISEQGWRTNWHRGLTLSLTPLPVKAWNRDEPDHPEALFFHLSVRNQHISRSALSCVGYLKSAVGPLQAADQLDGQQQVKETAELKWAGAQMPQVPIMSGTERKLDAFHVWLGKPGALRFNQHVDSTQFECRLTKPGYYRLTYALFSENLPEVGATLLVHHTGSFATMMVQDGTLEERDGSGSWVPGSVTIHGSQIQGVLERDAADSTSGVTTSTATLQPGSRYWPRSSMLTSPGTLSPPGAPGPTDIGLGPMPGDP